MKWKAKTLTNQDTVETPEAEFNNSLTLPSSGPAEEAQLGKFAQKFHLPF